MTETDVVVLGLGGMGSAALLAAARAGLKAVGIEQFGEAHDRGSSHGETRIIRTAYYEHPNYVPLARRAIGMWRAIEAETGGRLMEQVGLLQVGAPDSEVMRGVLESERRHGLALDHLSPAEVEARWPWWRVPPGQLGLFEREAGFLRVERCVATMLGLARSLGARTLFGATISGWDTGPGGTVQVTGGGETFRTRGLIVTAGPWTGPLLKSRVPALQVVRKQQQWFEVDAPRQPIEPCWLVDEGEAGCFYGFPPVNGNAFKVAEHSGGQPVNSATAVNRQESGADILRCQDFLRRWFRHETVRQVRSSVCMYTLSPDQHFLLDRLPDAPQIVFLAGLSGHGFKFAPVLGDLLVGKVRGEDCPDAAFLGLDRFHPTGTGSG